MNVFKIRKLLALGLVGGGALGAWLFFWPPQPARLAENRGVVADETGMCSPEQLPRRADERCEKPQRCALVTLCSYGKRRGLSMVCDESTGMKWAVTFDLCTTDEICRSQRLRGVAIHCEDGRWDLRDDE